MSHRKRTASLAATVFVSVGLLAPALAARGQEPEKHCGTGTPFLSATNHGLNPAQAIAACYNSEAELKAEMRRRRLDTYKRMQKDTRAIQQVVAELSAEVEGGSPSPGERAQQLAQRDAQKIQKLAAGINKQMIQAAQPVTGIDR